MQGKQSMAATSGDEWMDEGDGSGAKEVEEGRGEALAFSSARCRASRG